MKYAKDMLGERLLKTLKKCKVSSSDQGEHNKINISLVSVIDFMIKMDKRWCRQDSVYRNEAKISKIQSQSQCASNRAAEP